MRFRKAIRATAPAFRPYERRYAASRTLPAITFIANEEEKEEDTTPQEREDIIDEEDAICIDEVFERAQTYVL